MSVLAWGGGFRWVDSVLFLECGPGQGEEPQGEAGLSQEDSIDSLGALFLKRDSEPKTKPSTRARRNIKSGWPCTKANTSTKPRSGSVLFVVSRQKRADSTSVVGRCTAAIS